MREAFFLMRATFCLVRESRSLMRETFWLGGDAWGLTHESFPPAGAFQSLIRPGFARPVALVPFHPAPVPVHATSRQFIQADAALQRGLNRGNAFR